jgi:Cu(I)/Ag(I) efflux system membrane fusion protein
VFCEIEDVRTMRVVAKVAENDLDLVEKGQATSIKVANLPTRVFTGEVTFISPIVEEDTASGAHFFRIETVIKNDDGLLKPNLSGFAKLHAGSRPLWAVITRGLVRWLRLRFLF